MPNVIPHNRCLPPETLRQFLANELSEDLESSVLAHLEACTHCQELCDSVARSDQLEDVRSKLVRLQREKEPTAVAALRHELYAIDDTVSRAGESDTQNIPAAPSVELPRIFGGYELLEEIARGGMGVVYKARQIKLDRIVAVKMILAGEFASAEGIRRFTTEAQAAANLDHPHIVPIYEVGEHAGRHFYSMGYVEGESLARLVAHGPLAPREAAEMMRKIAEAVQYAHEKGVIHRDLKPGNILLSAECGARSAESQQTSESLRTPHSELRTPKITDFGLAKRVQGDSELTSTGQVLGTPSYMPPEQARGEATIGPLADIYSLGAILYCLLTGRPPFQTASVMETLKQVLERDPLPPRQLNPDIPRDLETITLKCLEKSPDRRYRTAQELADELDRYLHHRPILARPVSRSERAWRWCKRNTVVASLSTLAMALLIGVATVSTGGYLREARLTNELQVKTGELQAKAGDLQTKTTALAKALANETTERMNANNKEIERRRELNRFYVAKGLDLADKGDLFGALLWFARPLQPGDGPLLDKETHRLRLSCYWRMSRKPTLVGLLHDDQGVALAGFSPDGSQILETSNGSARIWDVAPYEFVTPSISIQGFGTAFSPDGRQVLISSQGIAQLWDVATGRAVGAPMARNNAAPATFSPDGHLVMLATSLNGRQLHDTATGKPLGSALVHSDRIRTATFSSDSRQIVTASLDGTAQRWNAASSAPLGPPLKHTGKCYSADFSDDGRKVVTCDDKGVHIWDTETAMRVTLAESDLLLRDAIRDARSPIAVMSPNGKRILVLAHVDKCRIWDVETLKPISSAFGGNISFAFSPNSQLAAIDTSLWDLTKGERISLDLPKTDGGHVPAFTADGRRIIMNGPQIHVLDVDTYEHVLPPIWTAPGWIGHGKMGSAPNSRRLAIRSDQTLAIWDFAENGSSGILMEFTGTALSADASRVLTIRDGKRIVWDRGAGSDAINAPLSLNRGIESAVFSPDGRSLVTIDADKTAQLWDSKSGAPVGQPLSRFGKVGRATFSPDNRLVVTTPVWPESGEVRVWRVSTGEETCPPLASGRFDISGFNARSNRIFLTGRPDGNDESQVWDALSGELITARPIRGAAQDLSPDGQRLLVRMHPPEDVGVHDATTGQLVGKRISHKQWIYDACFSPDGSLIVTASGDNTARVWNAATMAPISPPLIHEERVWSAAFSPNGQLIVTGVSRGFRVWDVASGQPISPLMVCKVDKHPVMGTLSARNIPAFSPDGRTIIAKGLGTPNQIWDVSLDPRPAEDWVMLTELLTGSRADRAQGIETVAADEREQQWKVLSQKYPLDLSVLPTSARAWHYREFSDPEKKDRSAGLHLYHAGIIVPWQLKSIVGTFRYAMEPPGDKWFASDWDDSDWKQGAGHLGEKIDQLSLVGTDWTGSDVWVRRTFKVFNSIPRQCSLVIRHSGDAQVYLNGEQIADLTGSTLDYAVYRLSDEALARFQNGVNTLAIHCRHAHGEHFLDAGIVDDPEEPRVKSNLLNHNTKPLLAPVGGRSAASVRLAAERGIKEFDKNGDGALDVEELKTYRDGLVIRDRDGDGLVTPLEEHLALMQVKLGADHLNTLAAMNKLAEAYRDARKFDRAQPLFEESLVLGRAKLGAEHHDTLNIMNNLAFVYKSMGKFDLALPLYEETLAVRMKLGADHPDTLRTMNNLATAYLSAGKLDLALPLFEETLALRRAKLSVEHPDTLSSMNNLATAYQDAGKPDLAMPLLEERLALVRAKLGSEHPNTLSSMYNLARACLAAKRTEESLAQFEAYLSAQRSQLTQDQDRLAGVLANVSAELLKHGQLVTAETYLRECLSIRQQKLPDSVLFSNTQSMLGESLSRQRKFDEAEPLLLAGWTGLKERQEMILAAARHARLIEALDRLVHHYEATGNTDEAKKWQAEAGNLPPMPTSKATQAN